jgi:hypothetical protein
MRLASAGRSNYVASTSLPAAPQRRNGRGEIFKSDSLDLIERDLIAGTIAELRCAWAPMRRDVHGLDIGELADAVLLDSRKKGAHSSVIGHAGVLIADLGGEEFQESARGMVAGIGDRRRHRDCAAK